MRKTIVWLLIVAISMTLVFPHSDGSSKGRGCCSTKAKTTKTSTEQKLLSSVSFEELLSGKTLNVDFSSTKSVLVFIDKETVKDYNQVENFSKWLSKKNLDIKVYTILSGNNKEELKTIAKNNNILSALWSPFVINKINVQKYPMAYYVVNGYILEKTEKIEVGHLRKMVWCKKCEKVRDENCCKYNTDDRGKVEKGS
ncbi:MAG: hypothetical protein N2657_05545 [bacterium]|nr:hypothetical protein [bacterium]